jgi:hypothetical protein
MPSEQPPKRHGPRSKAGMFVPRTYLVLWLLLALSIFCSPCPSFSQLVDKDVTRPTPLRGCEEKTPHPHEVINEVLDRYVGWFAGLDRVSPTVSSQGVTG